MGIVGGKRWGPWRLSNDGRALERNWDDPIRHRPLDLYRCTTAAEVLDTIFHEARAGVAEADDAMLAGLVRALDDLLDPMANLCSDGKAKTLSRAAASSLRSSDDMVGPPPVSSFSTMIGLADARPGGPMSPIRMKTTPISRR